MKIDIITKKAKFILRNLNEQDAEDILQEVFLSILEAKPDIKFNHYYDTAIRNEMIIFINKNKKYGGSVSVEDLVLPDYKTTEEIEYNNLVKALLGEFKYREDRANTGQQLRILLHMIYNEATVPEISEDFGMKYDTAKSNVRYIRDKLKAIRSLIAQN